METNDRFTVLETISRIGSVAENELNEAASFEQFLVMPNYKRLRDPSRFLILGGRGTGKTRLFQMLTLPGGFSKLIGEQRQLVGPNADNTDVVIGYQMSRTFPSMDILDQFADEKSARAFWAGSLIILLMNAISSNDLSSREIISEYLPTEYLPKFASINYLKMPGQWLPFIQQNPETWENVLDKIDELLEKQNRWLIVAYDSLDRLTSQYSDLFPFLRTLLSFWHTHSKRWRRLRCKIFLRNDLYQSQLLAFPDASKISNCLINLSWNTDSLYQLLIKRMANAGSEETVNYLKQISGLITSDPDPDLGYKPNDHKEILSKFMNMMVGEYMGKDPKKGKSYSWPPNHLQDANGDLAPRSFLKCFSSAAEDMCNHPDEVEKLSDARLILPARIQGALLDVSNERVQELQEEYPWLEELKSAFSGLTMLMNQEEFIEHIDMELWSEEQKKTLPANSPHEIFAVLQKLGIVMVASDGRVNVPEIYLHGFKMKRKGGLRRPA